MWSDRIRRLLALSLVLIVAVAMTGVLGCATEATEDEGDGGEEAATETIRIGVQTALTGPLPDYGEAAQRGCELAAEDFSGFEVDGTTYKIELVVLDDKAEPSEAAVVAQSLVDEGVVGVIGGLTTGATLAAMPIYNDAGVPQISGSVTGPKANETDFDNFFRTCWNDAVQGEALAVWADELGFKKVTIVDDAGAYAVGLADVTQNTLDEKGAETQRMSVEEGGKDFSAQIANITEFDPDAVIFTGYHPEAGLLRKQLVEAGLDVGFMGGDGIKSTEFINEAGGAENAEGCYATFGSFPEDQQPGYAEFAEKYDEAYGSEVGPYAQNNYDALGVLVAAIEQAQSFESADVVATLHEIEYEGVTGTFSFADATEGAVTMGDIVVSGLTPENVPRYIVTGGEWIGAE